MSGGKAMEENKERSATIKRLMISVFILIIITLIFGFCFFGNGLAPETFLALFLMFFLWLNIIFILLKLEQISLRDRMIDPILMRRLSNIIVLIAITILIIIIVLIVRVFFASLFI